MYNVHIYIYTSRIEKLKTEYNTEKIMKVEPTALYKPYIMGERIKMENT